VSWQLVAEGVREWSCVVAAGGRGGESVELCRGSWWQPTAQSRVW
jgi:hypothetical protein